MHFLQKLLNTMIDSFNVYQHYYNVTVVFPNVSFISKKVCQNYRPHCYANYSCMYFGVFFLILECCYLAIVLGQYFNGNVTSQGKVATYYGRTCGQALWFFSVGFDTFSL